MKIAVIASGNIYQQHGLFNAVLNRVKHLKRVSDASIDVFLLSTYESFWVRCLRHTKKYDRPGSVVIDGVVFLISWSRFSLIDYVLTTKFHTKSFVSKYRHFEFEKGLGKYDFVVAHSLRAGSIALWAKLQYGVPFSVTWHGSDIHTFPVNNESTKQKTKQVIEAADINYFVSADLLEKSKWITLLGNKVVLYNGADERFVKYDERKRSLLREKYGVEGKKVVTFVGNFFEIKNVLKIPRIFQLVSEHRSDVVFWMVGDGKLLGEVKRLSNGLPIVFWGNQPPDKIPFFLNCTDVQILPSINEGLPLTMVESLRCGCHAIGSLVGGIPEVIGTDNCIPLDSQNFEERFAEKILYYLDNMETNAQLLDSKFSWEQSAKIEFDLYSGCLSK